ncbi:MAG: hypothetical protein ACD_8C00054G0008 [uncultured bacterium]|nr:MAG: hypothetical protein ACD_8C00054G0008 [uncultured bacterium]
MKGGDETMNMSGSVRSVSAKIGRFNLFLRRNDYCDKDGYYDGWLARRAMVIKISGLEAKWQVSKSQVKKGGG